MKPLHRIPLAVLVGVLASCGGGGSSTDGAAASGTGSGTTGGSASAPLAPAFTDTPSAVTQSAFARFSFSAPDAQGYQCRLDDGEFVACTSPHLVYPLDARRHQLAVRSVAADGSFSAATTTEWTVASLFGDGSGGAVHPDLIPTTVQPAPAAPGGWRGIFRINCDFAHAGYVDPIVFPGQADAAHLHRFYGNTLLDEHSDTASLFTSGSSSCQGNELNRSAYWIPALLAPAYDGSTGQRLLDAQGQPAWRVVPEVVGGDEDAHEVFYYSAGVDDLASIQPIPLGLKMIAGNGAARPGTEQDTSIVRWHCQSWQSDDATNPRWSTHIPECLAPDRVRMDIFFPSCWNGTDLDSPDHKSHLAYPVASGGPAGMVCPSTHPVPIVRVSFHYAWGVKPEVFDPATRSSRGWRLASDGYEASPATPGGVSLHGDWFNAWHPQALQAILDGCIRRRLDCHDGNLANGYRLSGTRPGTQYEPPIVNGGHGH